MKGYFRFFLFLQFSFFLVVSTSCSTKGDELSALPILQESSPTDLKCGYEHNLLLNLYLQDLLVSSDTVPSSYQIPINYITCNYMFDCYGDSCKSVVNALTHFSSIEQIRAYLQETDSCLLCSSDTVYANFCLQMKSRLYSYVRDDAMSVNDIVDSVRILSKDLESLALSYKPEYLSTCEVAIQIMESSAEYWSDENNMSAWSTVARRTQGKNDKKDDRNMNDNDKKDDKENDDKSSREKLKKAVVRVVTFVVADALGAFGGSGYGPQGMVAAGTVNSALTALSWED